MVMIAILAIKMSTIKVETIDDLGIMLGQCGPELVIHEIPENKSGFKSKLHIVVVSDHELQLLLFRRTTGDALCKTKKWFDDLVVFRDDDEKEMAVDRICPRCLSWAKRLNDAKKAFDGKIIRYLEERHV